MRATSGISRSLYTERLGRPAYRAAFRCGTHYGKVWVNNQEVMEHQGGLRHLKPMSRRMLLPGKVYVSRLCEQRTELADYPAGNGDYRENGKKKQSYFHDFFNYAGILAA